MAAEVVAMTPERARWRRQAILLQYATILYNLLEAAASLIAGLLAGSIALVGFGLDGAIEISASVAVLLHLKRNGRKEGSVWEQRVAVFVGATLLVLAFVIWNEAVLKIATQSEPDTSLFGVGVAIASLLIMPGVSKREADLARKLRSPALAAEARETLVCSWLSAALLVGLGANLLFGLWWADPAVAMVMTALIGREGWLAITERDILHQHHHQHGAATRDGEAETGQA
jgi:divalent metal cation (Fe/Co/Zn/Cd) transporter